MAWQEIVLRLGLAVIAGMLIGTERERSHRPAGVKTHILVCMGATLVSLIQVEMVSNTAALIAAHPELANTLKTDYGRLGAQVISGIGFLGAGTIIHTRGSVRGLTTAATLWMVACIGLAIGMGYYVMSGAAVALSLLMMFSLKFLQSFVRGRVGEKTIEVKFINKQETMTLLNDYFINQMIDIKQIELTDTSADQPVDPDDFFVYECTYTVLLPRSLDIKTVIAEIGMEKNVVSVSEGS